MLKNILKIVFNAFKIKKRPSLFIGDDLFYYEL